MAGQLISTDYTSRKDGSQCSDYTVTEYTSLINRDCSDYIVTEYASDTHRDCRDYTVPKFLTDRVLSAEFRVVPPE